jgi:hypothetical protein
MAVKTVDHRLRDGRSNGRIKRYRLHGAIVASEPVLQEEFPPGQTMMRRMQAIRANALTEALLTWNPWASAADRLIDQKSKI